MSLIWPIEVKLAYVKAHPEKLAQYATNCDYVHAGNRKRHAAYLEQRQLSVM